ETPIDMVLDVGLGALRETVTGDDAVGYRVAMTTAFTGEEMVYFVVREDGGYKIAGFAQALDSLGREALRRLERSDLQGARQWLDWAREEVWSGGGDDPLAFSPFTILWTRGAEATAEEARCAAASLLAGSASSDISVPLLLACRDAAPQGSRTAIDLSLSYSYQRLKRYAEMADTAQRLAAAAPRSLRAYELLTGALAKIGRWDDVRRLAEQRLAAAADDPAALRSLHRAAEQRGEIEEAGKHLQRLVNAGKADDTDFNNLAWLALFHGTVDERAIETAQRAVMLDDYEDPSSLHTLASLYAELGKNAEAYKVILQALEAGSGTPYPHDWYVFGRLAEHYGLPEAARRYYERVEAPETGEADFASTWRLARQRLALLGPEGKEPKQARRK
ncbi:MAG: tetratricopeptide repeat protein, partial [Thermoanaerobaculia bacterium]